MKVLFLSCVTTLSFFLGSSRTIMESQIKSESEGFEFFQSCYESMIGIYDAHLHRTGDREKSIEMALDYYDWCIEDELGIE